MRRPFARFVAVVCLGMLARAPAAVAANGDPLALAPGTRLLAPIVFRQLALFPVAKTEANRDRTQYLTLTEGLKQHLIEVAEAGAHGEVNRVMVKNRAAQPLLLLGGEVILGGQQDRIIGQDTVVPAHEELALPVFCVEHGRWSGARQFTAAQGMADGKVRVRAKYRGRQDEVWQEVAKKNEALGAKPATGTYRNLATGDEGQRALAPYRKAIAEALGKLPERASLVGVVAAINGRVINVELFDRPELFAAYRDKLLDSIYLSVADAPATTTPAPPPKPADIDAFVEKAKKAPAVEVARHKDVATREQRGAGVVRSEVAPAAAPGPVYQSYQADE